MGMRPVIAILCVALFVACARGEEGIETQCTMRESGAGALIECGNVIVTIARDPVSGELLSVWCAATSGTAEADLLCALVDCQ